MSDAIKEFQNKKFTLQGRIFFPNLLEATARGVGKRKTFNTMFSWVVGSNPQVMQEIQNHLAYGMQIAHQGIDIRALVNPIKKFDTYIRQSGKPVEPYLNNCYWLNASTGENMPPAIVHQNMVPLTAFDKAELYSGRNAIICVNFYVQLPKPGDANQKRGFGCNFSAVMLAAGGDRVQTGGGVPTDINAVFGQFKQDMVPAFQGGQTFGQQAPAAPAPQYPAQQQYPQQPAQAPYLPAQPAQAPYLPAQPAYNPNQAPGQPYPTQPMQAPVQMPAQPAWPPVQAPTQAPAQQPYNPQAPYPGQQGNGGSFM